MTTAHIYIAASLDGFIARPDHSLDWLMKQPTEGEEQGFEGFMDSVDGLVMGRKTYEVVLGFGGDWPYHKPVVVMSRSLTDADIPAELKGKVRVSPLGPEALMAELAGQGWKRAYIDGGQVIQAFLRAGLAADLVLTHIPILIGEGISLFGTLDRDIDLRHSETRTFPSGLVQSTYEILPRPGQQE